MGPTASGKSALAEALADRFGAALLNADAFLVYRGLDVGTAKPKDRARYALLDIKDPTEPFGLGEWLILAHGELAKLWESQKPAIVVGGTGLYIRALFEEYQSLSPAPSPALRQSLMAREREEGLQALADALREIAPEVAMRTDLKNPVRVRRALERELCRERLPLPPLPPFRRLKVGLLPDPDALDIRIRERVERMFREGWQEEVAELLAKGVSLASPGMRAIGYKTVAAVLNGDVGLNEAIGRVTIETRQYAKRQRTWLRSEPAIVFHSGFGDEAEALAVASGLILSFV